MAKFNRGDMVRPIYKNIYARYKNSGSSTEDAVYLLKQLVKMGDCWTITYVTSEPCYYEQYLYDTRLKDLRYIFCEDEIEQFVQEKLE